MSLSHQRLAISVSETAQMLGISRARLYPLISRGEIPSFKIGGRRLVPVKALESFIERQLQLSMDESGGYASAS